MKEDRDLVTALARGLQVLSSFTAKATALTGTDLAERTGLPKATVARLTYTLVELGYLRRVSPQRKYTLSPAVLTLAYPLLASLSIRQLAEPLMRELSVETGATVSMGVLDSDRVVYVESCRSRPFLDHLPDIGASRPLMESAIGRALLAGLDAKERTRLLNTMKVREPERYARSIADVERALRDFKRMGYCVSLGDMRAGFHVAATPLREPFAGQRLALNCGMLSKDRTGEALRRDVAPKLVLLARKVEGLVQEGAASSPR